MATKVLTTLQDDIDGSDASETVRFALDGVEWEIDLSDRKAVRKWAQANGIEVSARGRIPAEIVERYRAAGN